MFPPRSRLRRRHVGCFAQWPRSHTGALVRDQLRSQLVMGLPKDIEWRHEQIRPRARVRQRGEGSWLEARIVARDTIAGHQLRVRHLAGPGFDPLLKIHPDIFRIPSWCRPIPARVLNPARWPKHSESLSWPEKEVRKGFVNPRSTKRSCATSLTTCVPVIQTSSIIGWRISEVLSRQWRHVDFKDGWIRLKPGETKNGRGRAFPLIPRAARCPAGSARTHP